MPNLVQGKKANFGSSKTKGKAKEKPATDEEEQEDKPARKPAQSPAAKRASSLIKGTKDERYSTKWAGDDDEGDDDEDEVIQDSIKEQETGGGFQFKYLVGGIAVVIAVALAFVIFNRANNSAQPAPTPTPSSDTPVVTTPSGPGPSGVGTQDFSGDTNRTSDSPLTDPNNFIKDIYGLTLQVNYDVAEIQSAADFVNYTKYRGTWGSGLELYWLAAEYKGNTYSIQVPFKYYKELDDSGIVPVKMEVLRIKSDTSDGYLTVISYMELDITTLQTIMKSQTKK